MTGNADSWRPVDVPPARFWKRAPAAVKMLSEQETSIRRRGRLTKSLPRRNFVRFVSAQARNVGALAPELGIRIFVQRCCASDVLIARFWKRAPAADKTLSEQETSIRRRGRLTKSPPRRNSVRFVSAQARNVGALAPELGI